MIIDHFDMIGSGDDYVEEIMMPAVDLIDSFEDIEKLKKSLEELGVEVVIYISDDAGEQ